MLLNYIAWQAKLAKIKTIRKHLLAWKSQSLGVFLYWLPSTTFSRLVVGDILCEKSDSKEDSIKVLPWLYNVISCWLLTPASVLGHKVPYYCSFWLKSFWQKVNNVHAKLNINMYKMGPEHTFLCLRHLAGVPVKAENVSLRLNVSQQNDGYDGIPVYPKNHPGPFLHSCATTELLPNFMGVYTCIRSRKTTNIPICQSTNDVRYEKRSATCFNKTFNSRQLDWTFIWIYYNIILYYKRYVVYPSDRRSEAKFHAYTRDNFGIDSIIWPQSRTQFILSI